MTSRRSRTIAAPSAATFLRGAALALACPSFAWAGGASPFGAGLPDGGIPGAAWFPRLAGTLISLQFYLNQHITAAVRDMRHDGRALWTLLGLSFLYGIVHAAGPGHGKAVVSSYILANRQTLRNGIALAFLSSLAQAVCAIVLILLATLVLRMTSVSITNTTFRFEILSDILIVLLGVWLIWSKVLRPARFPKLDVVPAGAAWQAGRVSDRSASSARPRCQAVDLDDPAVLAAQAESMHRASPADDRDGRLHLRCGCGHAHMPDAGVAAGSLDWRKAWTVVASTALRPCTGALIVLVFSISQKMLFAGIAATLVMGLGTAITVASLAGLAVSARHTASVLTRADGPRGRRVVRAVEACGSIAVFLFGTLLLLGNVLP